MSYSPQSEAPLLALTYSLPEEQGELRYSIERQFSQIANKVNVRDISIYDLVENQTGQQWFIENTQTTKRFGYRICYVETLGGVLTNISHGITDIAECRVTRLYGVLQDSPFTQAISIPNGGPSNTNLSITATNIIIGDPTATYTGFEAYIVLEFVRNR